MSCDNEAAVTGVNSDSSKDPFMQRCLRELWFTAAVHDCKLTARHIPGAHNVLADALSRWRTNSAYRELFYESAARLDRQYTFQAVSIILIFMFSNSRSCVGFASYPLLPRY